MSTNYAQTLNLKLDFDTAVNQVKEALIQAGFGILTEIDFQATVKAKLGIDSHPRQLVLGACHPPSAYKILGVESEAGLLLPCSVMLHEDDGQVKLSLMEPESVLGLSDNPRLHQVAREIRARLDQVVKTVTS